MATDKTFHIRSNARKHGHDRRTRGCSGRNKPSPTMCGGDPTDDDTDKRSARNALVGERFYGPGTITREWLSRMCAGCRALLTEGSAQ